MMSIPESFIVVPIWAALAGMAWTIGCNVGREIWGMCR